MLARSALITRWNSNQVPWDPSRELHRVPAPMDHSMELQPGAADGSKVVHTSGPWIHGCAYFRPWDPRLCIMLAPMGSIEGTASSPLPWDPSRELHRVPSRGDCIMLARSALITRWNSNQVPWIHRGNSNQVPWDPWLCILPAHGSKVVHHAGHRVPSRGIDRGNCIESRPAAPTSTGPHGID
jgi:hypothetical protein